MYENTQLLSEITKLRHRVEQLEKGLKEINERLNDTITSGNDLINDVVGKLCDQRDDMHDRVCLLEGKVFPGIPADMAQLKDVIGPDDDTGEGCKYDRRKGDDKA